MESIRYRFYTYDGIPYEFEYNKDKNERNIALHGVGFSALWPIWADENLIIAPAKKRDEKRWMAIGKAENSVYTVIFTKRQNRIRLISARRATRKEAMLYEQKGRTR